MSLLIFSCLFPRSWKAGKNPPLVGTALRAWANTDSIHLTFCTMQHNIPIQVFPSTLSALITVDQRSAVTVHGTRDQELSNCQVIDIMIQATKGHEK